MRTYSKLTLVPESWKPPVQSVGDLDSSAPIGQVRFVVDLNKFYYVNPAGVWVPLPSGGGGGGSVDISIAESPTHVDVIPSSGLPGRINGATAIEAGVMTSAQVVKLNAAPQPFVYSQSIAATVWTVNHNLGYYPGVTLFTTGGVEFNATVVNLSFNVLQVLVNAPTAGFARCI